VPVDQPQPHSISVPAPLRGIKGWLLWKSEQTTGEKKPRKIAYYASGMKRHGEQGSEQERARLVTYDVAHAAYLKGGYDGLAFAPLSGFNVVALDFDNCVTDGKIAPEVLKVIDGTYAELSPSGKGVRALFRGDIGNHKKISKDGSIGFETFSTSGFVTITGRVLYSVEIVGLEDTVEDITNAVTEYCAKRFGHDTRDEISNAEDPLASLKPKLGLSVSEIEALLAQLDPDMDRDEWIRVGMAVHHECEGDDTGFEIWNDWSANGAKYPSEENLREQWDSFDRARNKGRQVSMATVKRMVKQATTPKPGAANADEILARISTVKSDGPRSAVSTPDTFEGKFKAYSAGSMSDRPPPDWLIDDVIPKADVMVLFGASGSGKSFVALDMAACIARGIPWRGNHAEKGRVLIIAAEGGGGMGKRIKAYCLHHGIDPYTLDISVVIAAPNFMLKDDISEVAATVKAAGGFDLIIADTFAQVTPGANENAGEDMGLAINNAKVLRDVTGAMVLLVHHSGKDASRGARGWSGIKAAMDAEIEVIKHDNGEREIRLTKMKDGDDGLRWGVKLEILPVGKDARGKEITSCVALETDAPVINTQMDDSPRKGVRRFSSTENHILEIVAGIPELSALARDKLVMLCAESLPAPEAGGRDNRMVRINAAITDLCKGKDAPFREIGGVIHFLVN